MIKLIAWTRKHRKGFIPNDVFVVSLLYTLLLTPFLGRRISKTESVSGCLTLCLVFCSQTCLPTRWLGGGCWLSVSLIVCLPPSGLFVDYIRWCSPMLWSSGFFLIYPWLPAERSRQKTGLERDYLGIYSSFCDLELSAQPEVVQQKCPMVLMCTAVCRVPVYTLIVKLVTKVNI